jgi:alpha-tubulin suppressor-like RCC1 family protein
MSRRTPAVVLALVVGVLLGCVTYGPLLSWAAWTAVDAGAAGTFATASSWAGPMDIWGWGAGGRTGVLMPVSSTTSAWRMPGPERWSSVSSAPTFACGITTGAALLCWGTNGSGQLGTGDTASTWEPAAVTGGLTWSAVSTGYVDTCAIRASDATLWCWGDNGHGQVGNGTTGASVTSPTPVTTSGTSTWASVTLGENFACGLKTDHTLWCWGLGAFGQLGVGDAAGRTVPTQVGAASWAAVSAGRYGACGIATSDSSLWCWGNGASGQLGNGDTADQVVPVPVSGGGTWTAVVKGQGSVCARRTDATVWCWGDNGQGELGDGTTTERHTPVQEATGSTTWTTLTAMEHGFCATRVGGQLSCWGRNAEGELGDGTTTERTSPVSSGTATDWSVLSGGAQALCGVRSDQAIWCQGSAAFGQLGQHYGISVGSPTPLQPPSARWLTGSVGYSEGCGVRADRTLWCWGFNAFGQTGSGTTAEQDQPVQAGVATTWSSVSVGTYAVCGIQQDHSLWCWGGNGFHQLGTAAVGNVTTPTAGPAGSWSQVALGETHTCGISAAGSLSCWGDNGSGELGTGDWAWQNTPAAVTGPGVTTWSTVSTGAYSTCAIAATGAAAGGLFCWGSDGSGQLGDGGGGSQNAPVRIGSDTWSAVTVGNSTACGIRSDGSLWCWGGNGHGQLGGGGAVGVPGTVSLPQRVGVLTGWTTVGVGDEFACATRAGSLWCWGRDDNGQLGDRGSASVTSPQPVPGSAGSWVEAHARADTVLAQG